MNAAVTEDQAPMAEGPGSRLKALRESQDLDLPRVATLLHLSEEKLEALEADDYASLPGPVFIQGYLRNYARFLGVPTEPILTAYHRLNPEKGHLPDLKIAQVSHEVGSSHVLVRMITWLIIIGLLALVVVWWRGYLQWPIQSSPGESEPPVETSEAVGDDGEPVFPETVPLAEISGEGQATLMLPGPATGEEQPVTAPDERVAVPVPQQSDAIPTVIPAASPTGPAEEPATSVSLTDEAEPPVTESFQSVARDDGRVVIQFDGTSWTKINDASGRFRIMGEVDAGTRQVLEGTPPYDLVLGKAAMVRVFVDGRELDITPYTRGNVARLSLDPDKIGR